MLSYAALSKISAAIAATKLSLLQDPVLPINARSMLLLAGLLEAAVAGYLVIGRRWRTQCLLILWLGVTVAHYWIASWWLASGQPCPWLGTSRVGWNWLPIRGGLLVALVFAMVAGGAYYLGRQRLVQIIGCCGAPSRRGLKRLLVITASLLVVPAIQTIWVAWASPPITGPMVVRAVGGWFASQPRSPISQQWLKLDAVPADFLKALLIVEDGKFFEHDGFALNEIRMAVHEMIRTGQRPRGASTITQQCARSLFLWQGRSWMRKGLEAYYTFWMELILSKKRILELYVNVIELGDGVYGLEAGARHHFAKGAGELTRQEIAALAALLPAPRVWNINEPNTRQRLRQEAIIKQLEHTRLPLEGK